jgi:hypothetical protein
VFAPADGIKEWMDMTSQLNGKQNLVDARVAKSYLSEGKLKL